MLEKVKRDTVLFPIIFSASEFTSREPALYFILCVLFGWLIVLGLTTRAVSQREGERRNMIGEKKTS